MGLESSSYQSDLQCFTFHTVNPEIRERTKTINLFTEVDFQTKPSLEITGHWNDICYPNHAPWSVSIYLFKYMYIYESGFGPLPTTTQALQHQTNWTTIASVKGKDGWPTCLGSRNQGTRLYLCLSIYIYTDVIRCDTSNALYHSISSSCVCVYIYKYVQ